MTHYHPFHRFTILLSLTAMLTISTAVSAAWADTARHHFRVGFSSRLFPNVPTEDVRAGVHVLTRKIARRILGDADSVIYDSFRDLERDIKSKRVDALAITAEEFFYLKDRRLIQPIILTCAKSGYEVSLCLVARNDSGLNRVVDLRNRVILLPSKNNQYGELYHYWLETLMLREGRGSSTPQATSLRETKSASQALMSVFFRKADACVVTEQTFATSCELNPQLGKELRVISRIGGLVGGVGIIRTDLPEDQKQAITNAMMTLHEDQEGKQVFMLFQLNRMMPYRPEYMKATEAFLREYRTLKAKAGKK